MREKSQVAHQPCFSRADHISLASDGVLSIRWPFPSQTSSTRLRREPAGLDNCSLTTHFPLFWLSALIDGRAPANTGGENFHYDNEKRAHDATDHADTAKRAKDRLSEISGWVQGVTELVGNGHLFGHAGGGEIHLE